MDKKSPIITASVASLVYFVIFIMLKYFLQKGTFDWVGALTGMMVFWAVIFVVHLFLKKRYNDSYI